MTAFVTSFNLEIGINLFTESNTVRQRFPVYEYATASFVQGILDIDQVALVLQQPFDPVVRFRRLLHLP